MRPNYLHSNYILSNKVNAKNRSTKIKSNIANDNKFEKYCKNIKEDSKSDNSFEAEENDNELVDKTSIQITKKSNHEIKLSTKYFEADMEKHGLLNNIENIQQLKNYFKSELGGCYLEDSKVSTTFEFSFHKRARSNSPPKKAELFDPKITQSSANQPIIPNFVLPSEISPQKQLTGDTGGLSTDPTNDEYKLMKNKEEENWMYKRLEVPQTKKETGKYKNSDLIGVINQLELDCENSFNDI